MEKHTHYTHLTNAIASVHACSPFLSHLLTLYPQTVSDMETKGVDATYEIFLSDFDALDAQSLDQTSLMHELRTAKGKLALLVALADIANLWTLEQVTGALSDFAQAALCLTLDMQLITAHKRGEIAHSDSQNSGIIVLGMGKLGGRELNYSSDIDLIIFFEPERLGYKGHRTEQHFMNKIAHDIVTIMQDRTKDGYVFRTDLRLRPDPASTPPAVTVNAGYYYYESVGQNWERAAMIKARPVAGDFAAGDKFLQSLTPFMWRRSLDFAAINDIHSIKRQMDNRQNKNIQLAGHNIKLGLGGIREIEFFAQIHQLIWGGREKKLRSRATCETLVHLVELNLIDEDKRVILTNAYRFHRQLEHRLQMVADAQTHTMPESPADIENIARFMGYDDMQNFSLDVRAHLNAVHEIYASSFRGAEDLGEQGNLVFTGVSSDPATVQTLRDMGYSEPERVSEIVMSWHHGARRATRTKRSRELLTELMPALLKRLSETASPDDAFLKFNEFLQNLPASVQLFSLFNMNPQLLGLIADIMGSAPTLAERLSKSPELLDAVLYADFYDTLPTRDQLCGQINDALLSAQDFEETMDKIRQFRNERQFQAGVQSLKRMITAHEGGKFLSDLADATVEKTLHIVTLDFEQTYGKIAGAEFAILALGKLGSREMTFSSDIDLVFVYDVPDFDAASDGEKSFTASVYYNRLAQRLLNAISGMGRDGRLYEVDTRLRPSGKQGLLAVSTKALQHYFDELAWTFEYMAFTKARVVTSNLALHDKLNDFICKQLAKPRDQEKLRSDVLDMRERIEKNYATKNPWDIKYVRGGLTDIDFIAQYLMLHHAPNLMGIRAGSALEIFEMLRHAHMLPEHIANELIAANNFLGQIFNMIRLCCDRMFDEETAPSGLKKLLIDSVSEKDFESLKNHVLNVEKTVYRHYNTLLNVTP